MKSGTGLQILIEKLCFTRHAEPCCASISCMKHLLSILVLFSLLPLVNLGAQGFGEDDNLYIPPKIDVRHPWSDRALVIDAQESIYPARFLPLPIIFFDNPGEWVIPQRYQSLSAGEAFEYSDTNAVLGWVGATGKYREILDIVGYRMTRDTSILLRLQGGWSAEPGEDSLLARERSQVVREYLQNTWGIDTNRLVLLPPTSPVDSASNSLLQQEARRVMMSSDNEALFGPVRFAYRIVAPLNMAMRLALRPNIDPTVVQSIEIRVLDHRKELLAHQTIPGHPDSTLYRYRANWWMHGDRTSATPSSLLVEARVITSDGRYRPSNQVSIPIREELSDYSDDMRNRREMGEIPAFGPGDTTLSAAQKLAIREYVGTMDSLNRLSGREGLFVAAQGEVDMAENPIYESAEVDARVASRRMERSAYISEREDLLGFSEGRSTLQIIIPREETYAEEYDREMMEREFIEREVEAAREQEAIEEESEELTEEDEGRLTMPFGPDSLADGRARAVISYVTDTLGVELLNGSLPEELSELEGESFSSVRTTGVISSSYSGYNIFDLPEDRWYARMARLYIETADAFDDIVRQSEERLERRRNRRSERTDSSVLDNAVEAAVEVMEE